MCFTPFVSITTALIEFLLAIILLSFFKKSSIRNFFALFMILLGIYQFTEFMVCTTNNPFLWAKIGFITYSFLPALGLHGALSFLNKKRNLIFLYSIPIAATLFAIFNPNFILSATCERIFINVDTILDVSGSLFYSLLWLGYILYYAGFIILACLIAYLDYRKQKNKLKKKIEIIAILGVILMTVPTFLLIILFPFLSSMFGSVLCHFALFVAIAAFIGAYLNERTN